MVSHHNIAQAFDLLAEAHDAFVFARHDLYTVRVTELLEAYLPPQPILHILDMGGGSGRWAIPLAAMGHRITLADISQGMLRRAQSRVTKKGWIQIVCMDAAEPAFEPEVFDALLTIGDLLSYLRDPRMALSTLRTVMRPGALFIGTVISRLGLAVKQLRSQDFENARQVLETGGFTERTIAELAQLASRQDALAPQYPLQLHSYTAAELKDLLEVSGLEPLMIAGINVLKCMAVSDGKTESGHDILECERWLATCDPWRNFSTNLFFVAR